MIRQRWLNLAFCSTACRERYLDKLAADHERLKAWAGFLAESTAAK
jgi:hypothetical protein